jgi:hypothetical protein
MASFPYSFYLTRKMTREPLNANKFLLRNSFVSSTALIFFIFGMFKMGTMENEMSMKYFSQYDMATLHQMAGTSHKMNYSASQQ